MIDPQLNWQDQLLQRAAPAVMVPKFEPLVALADNGHRYLLAQDGIYLEVHRPWIHIVTPVVTDLPCTFPYGTVKPERRFAFRSIDERLIDLFIQQARAARPNEFAAWITWNSTTRAWRYRVVDAAEASPGHIQYLCPDLLPDEHLVVDLHSHGDGAAYFSAQDDLDDAGSVKLAIVVGFDREPCSSARRLCVLGLSLYGDES